MIFTGTWITPSDAWNHGGNGTSCMVEAIMFEGDVWARIVNEHVVARLILAIRNFLLQENGATE